VIEQRLGTELNGPSDELGLGVVMESCEEAVPAGFPDVATIESELDKVKGQNGLMDREKNLPRSRREHQVQPPKRHRPHRRLNKNLSDERNKKPTVWSKRTRIFVGRMRHTDEYIGHGIGCGCP